MLMCCDKSDGIICFERIILRNCPKELKESTETLVQDVGVIRN